MQLYHSHNTPVARSQTNVTVVSEDCVEEKAAISVRDRQSLKPVVRKRSSSAAVLTTFFAPAPLLTTNPMWPPSGSEG